MSSKATGGYNSIDSLELHLRSWWSKFYSRPLKDPILESYHVYELAYEYFDKIERDKAAVLASEQEADKIEDEKIQEALDWVAEEEKKEAEALAIRRQQEAEEEKKRLQEQDEGWMIAQLKKQYGDDYGEDINLNM